MRFDPHAAALPVEAAWLVARAFGPTGKPPNRVPVDAELVWTCAEQLDLTARIGARVPPDDLSRALGERVAHRFRDATLRAVATSLQTEALCCDLSRLGGISGIPLLFLKGAALIATAATPLGARDLCDIDVLVPPERASELEALLVDKGWVLADVPACEHQLPPLTHEQGGIIEIHLLVPGLRLSGQRSATCMDLYDDTHSRDVDVGGCRLRVPSREVLIAHLLVHGIAQHGLSPLAYPMFRALADVQDLGLTPNDPSVARCDAWISRDVSHEEVQAMAELAERLGRGDDPDDVAQLPGAAGRLLRHMVLGVLDQDYAASMRLSAIAETRAEGLGGLLRLVLHAVWLTRGQIDVIYGRPQHRLGYLAWRAYRPVDIVVRAARHTFASWQYRRGSRRGG